MEETSIRKTITKMSTEELILTERLLLKAERGVPIGTALATMSHYYYTMFWHLSNKQREVIYFLANEYLKQKSTPPVRNYISTDSLYLKTIDLIIKHPNSLKEWGITMPLVEMFSRPSREEVLTQKPTPAFDYELQYDRYREGKPIKHYEYGIRYPDGTEAWPELSGQISREQLSSEDQRALFLQEYESNREAIHQMPMGKLVFIRRVITTSFGKPEDMPVPIRDHIREKNRIKAIQLEEAKARVKALEE